ncbi:MAG: aminopeptidase [Patescibacteria group bacterium]
MSEKESEQYYDQVHQQSPDVNVQENETMQQALHSMEQPEKEMTPEEREEFEKVVEGARNVIRAFDLKRNGKNTKGENLIIVTDAGVDPMVRRALEQAGHEAAGVDFRLVVSSAPEHAAQDFQETIDEKIKHADAVLYATSISRSHSKGTVDLISDHPDERISQLQQHRKQRRGVPYPAQMRLISITSASKEILTEGASQENPADLARRSERLAEFMPGVKLLHITTPEGTDLVLKPKKTATPEYENGKVDKPGKLANFPMGEWSTAVDLAETHGTLVVDGAVTMLGRLPEPITVNIEHGVAVSITGGASGDRVRSILEQANADLRAKEPDNPANAFRVAEIGIGTNSKAFRTSPEGKKISPPTSLEAEKGYGTIHIALGKNSIFNVPKTDPDRNSIPIHLDHVVMHPEVVAEMEDGRKITMITNGEFTF